MAKVSSVLSDPELPSFLSVEEARLMMCVKLYETHRLTLGQAAGLAGYSKRGFMEILGRMDVAVASYDPEELSREIEW